MIGTPLDPCHSDLATLRPPDLHHMSINPIDTLFSLIARRLSCRHCRVDRHCEQVNIVAGCRHHFLRTCCR